MTTANIPAVELDSTAVFAASLCVAAGDAARAAFQAVKGAESALAMIDSLANKTGSWYESRCAEDAAAFVAEARGFANTAIKWAVRVETAASIADAATATRRAASYTDSAADMCDEAIRCALQMSEIDYLREERDLDRAHGSSWRIAVYVARCCAQEAVDAANTATD